MCRFGSYLRAAAALVTFILGIGCAGDEPTSPRAGSTSDPGLAAEANRSQGAPQEHESVKVRVKPTAKVIEEGQAVWARVQVTCELFAGGDVLEALVTMTQENFFGEGFLHDVECDGKPHKHLARVQAFDGTFHRGEAFASAFVLICDEGSVCEQGQDSRSVKVLD